MGKPALDWSPIQLRLANQQKIVPLGRFPNVPVDIDGICTVADFEVIEIIDDSNPYPALLGIEWALDNDAVINLKKRQMTFEGKGLRVIVPLDPSQGERYIEPVRDEYQDVLDWTTSTISQRRKKIMLILLPKVSWIGSVTVPA